MEILSPIAGAQVIEAVRVGLSSDPKTLPPWLFYDAAGSRLFEEITKLPEYYLTRVERGILERDGAEMIALASGGQRLRIAELGAGSAEKTHVLLCEAVARLGEVIYEPVDVCADALEEAQGHIEREIAGVNVSACVGDYMQGLRLEACEEDERRLVLYIGSSMGNFERRDAEKLLKQMHEGLRNGDSLLLGVDLVKDAAVLTAAYVDAAGVTAAFNKNMLTRLNRELDADFNVDTFAHRAVWNAELSRMEMHLESMVSQWVHIGELAIDVDFAEGERIHTENSYKYVPGEAGRLLDAAGFDIARSWTDKRGWFEVCLGIRR